MSHFLCKAISLKIPYLTHTHKNRMRQQRWKRKDQIMSCRTCAAHLVVLFPATGSDQERERERQRSGLKRIRVSLAIVLKRRRAISDCEWEEWVSVLCFLCAGTERDILTTNKHNEQNDFLWGKSMHTCDLLK